jgi:hypothetical protein
LTAVEEEAVADAEAGLAALPEADAAQDEADEAVELSLSK